MWRWFKRKTSKVYCLMERQQNGAQILLGVYTDRKKVHEAMTLWAQRYDPEPGHYAYVRELHVDVHSPLLRRLPGRAQRDIARTAAILRGEK